VWISTFSLPRNPARPPLIDPFKFRLSGAHNRFEITRRSSFLSLFNFHFLLFRPPNAPPVRTKPGCLFLRGIPFFIFYKTLSINETVLIRL
jgi:hypothetical protein